MCDDHLVHGFAPNWAAWGAPYMKYQPLSKGPCRRSMMAVCLALSACARTEPSTPSHPAILVLGFDSISAGDWQEQPSPSDNGSVVVRVDGDDGRQLELSSTRDQEKKVIRRIDAFSLRGKRVLAEVQADLRLSDASASVSARLRLSLERASGAMDAWNAATSRRARTAGPATLQAAIDVPEDALSLWLELDTKGSVAVRFGAPRLQISTPSSKTESLKAETIEGLQSLAQLLGYLRFFHPSDQVARMDWQDFEAEAARQVLMARDRAELRRAMQWVIERTAPTALLYEGSSRPTSAAPARGAGTSLTRWVRIGSGDDGEPYAAFRSGISEPSGVGVLLLKTVPSQGCAHVTASIAMKTEDGAPVIELNIIPRRGSRSPGTASRVLTHAEDASFDADIPPDVTDITYGVRVGGVGILKIDAVELICSKRRIGSFASDGMLDILGTASHLYTVARIDGCNGCLRVARMPEHTFDAARDVVDVSLGSGMRLLMPIALWTDGIRTFPEVAAAGSYSPHPIPWTDPASRIASALDIWVTLRWFYPYFEDMSIDWQHELIRALIGGADARTSAQLFTVLSQLVAALHDDHASIYRSEYDNGILPLLFRQIGSKLYLLKGVGEYNSVLRRGSVLASMNGVPADTVVKNISSTISAATPGWLQAYLPLTLGDGPTGELLSITAQEPDGGAVSIRVPRVARARYLAQKREDRPSSGTEVAAGVYYVDLSTADDAMWKAILPKLVSARAVIGDLRNGASPAGFLILAHFIDHEIKSPYYDKPISSLSGKRYERGQWSILPLSPRLSAKLIFLANGRSASSPETILQYARGAGLGIVVGEQTGGTNGDVATFESLQGISVRFTGMRVLNVDGSVLHGHGITPDVVVHPTVTGVREGRDEILEAAIARSTAP